LSERAVKRLLTSAFFWSIANAAPAIAGPMIYELPEETAALIPGPGVETAQAYCSACHSADYVTIQPRNKGKAFWAAEVQKMIKVYRASISEADAAAITDYLATTY
jgi:mono/diheme cytochrome c family protein